jgi:hypothetical protein
MGIEADIAAVTAKAKALETTVAENVKTLAEHGAKLAQIVVADGKTVIANVATTVETEEKTLAQKLSTFMQTHGYPILHSGLLAGILTAIVHHFA